MAVDDSPSAITEVPSATAPTPLARLELPRHTEFASDATHPVPRATDAKPLTLELYPPAQEKAPKCAPSHSSPLTKPARNAAWDGAHTSRCPLPAMGTASAPGSPLASRPPVESTENNS